MRAACAGSTPGVHPWAVDYRRARPSRVPVRRRERILLTLSAWATELALAHGLGFYYIVLERQLVGALGELRHPVTSCTTPIS